MSSFTKPLVVKSLGKGYYELLEEFEYYTDIRGIREIITVPVGFITDFASIPKQLRWLFKPNDKQYAKSSVIHDFMYRKVYDRQFADEVFCEGSKVLGTPKWKRVMMYTALRLFGWIVWDKYAIKKESNVKN